MKKVYTLLAFLTIVVATQAQTFSLPGDGKWYRLASMGGRHAHIEYIYTHGTAHNPSLATGELSFINSRDILVQRHQTIGYQAWNQPQFALINAGGGAEIWVKATPGVDAGDFTVKYSLNATLLLGDVQDVNLADNGGTLTIYDKLNDDANTFYQNVTIPKGNLSIGTSDAHGYKLAVNGGIRAQEIKVESGPWPDYVFKPNYTLPKLSQLKSFIVKNQRLPQMPSEAEVAKNGINLGELVKLQTQKIEELTLYLIEKEQELRLQQQKNKLQDSRLTAVEKALSELTAHKNNKM